MIEHIVPPSVREEELSRYLRRAWPLLPGHVARDLLKKKDVRIGGARCGKGSMVRGGDTLEIYAKDAYFAPQGVEILYNDGHLICAVKPQGLPSLPDQDGVGADTMEARLQAVVPGARLCHRLDAGTGGVMLAAADDTVYEQAFSAFRDHRIGKLYSAILTAKPQKEEMTLRAQLFKDAKRSEVRVSDKARPGSKEIITRIRVRGGEKGLWNADLEPVTGRTHQLRAHTAYIGCPILGDDKYGNRDVNRDRGFTGRLCLWCARLTIPADSPLEKYRGLRFEASRPDWLSEK